MDEAGLLTNWKEAEITHGGLNKEKRKIVEATSAMREEKVNTPSGYVKSFKVTATRRGMSGRSRSSGVA